MTDDLVELRFSAHVIAEKSGELIVYADSEKVRRLNEGDEIDIICWVKREND